MTKAKSMPAEHRFGQIETGDEWERVVFNAAIYFTTFERTGRFGKGNRGKHMTFADAVKAATDRPRCLVYAVADSERHVCIPRSRWAEYLGLKSQTPSVKHTCKFCGEPGAKQIAGVLAHPSCWRLDKMR